MVVNFSNFKKSFSKLKLQGKSKLIKKENFLTNRANRFFVVLGIVFNLVAWLLVSVKLMSFPEPIILHYNAYFGIDLVGSGKEALLLPIAGLIVLILNYSLGVIFKGKDVLIVKIVLATSFLFNLIIDIALMALISVNQV
ncbi:MAG: hypothetical protein U9Q72_01610 [Patescibacteria group bacterium]|nr:hypothetical protein [Patescibacteria group bacterium]